MLIAAGLDPGIRPLVVPWLDDRAAFWNRLIVGRHPGGPALARVIANYVGSEQINSIVLGGDPDYRMIRDAGIRRLCGGVLRDPGDCGPDLSDILLARHPDAAMPTPVMGARAGRRQGHRAADG